MRRVIGMDIHRTFGEVVIWEDGRLPACGPDRHDPHGAGGLRQEPAGRRDEVVIEATGNCMAVSRVLSPFVERVMIANPLQVKAIAHAHVKTDKIDAGMLASLHAAGYPAGDLDAGCRQPSGCAGWWRGATRSSGIARGSRTRCIRSCTRT